jgi:hypothetical protein
MLTPFSLFAAGCIHDFLGLVPWYKYLGSKLGRAPSCDINNFTILGSHSDIPLVLAAVIDDLLRIAGLVAVAFVIVGAVQYITSQGNPEDTAKAQTTIINALIGMAVAVVAVAFVSYLGNQLGRS